MSALTKDVVYESLAYAARQALYTCIAIQAHFEMGWTPLAWAELAQTQGSHEASARYLATA